MLDFGDLMTFAALIFALGTLYRHRVSHESIPRRDVLRKYIGNLWQASDDPKQNGVDKSELIQAINEAKIVFGFDKNVVHTLDALAKAESVDQSPLLEKLAIDMAKAMRLDKRFWPKDFLGKPIYLNKS